MAEKQLTLTELAERQYTLSEALRQHTSARNYLFSIFSGETPAPCLQIADASIDMSKLPQDAVEQILAIMIEHEEKTAFDIWAELAATAKVACETITKVRQAQSEELRRQIAQAEEAQQIIPFRPKQPPVQDEAEVPTGWPGKK